MKKTSILVLASILLCLSAKSQNVERELEEKYHAYRDRLKKHFVIVGSDPGYSIPSVRLERDFQVWVIDKDKINLQIPDDQKRKAYKGNMFFGDAMIDHSHYIMVLATEYRLLKWAGKDLTSIRNELYYALNAVNRIDLFAESFFDPNVSGSKNGFLVRSDVPNGFYRQFAANGDKIGMSTGAGNGRYAPNAQKVNYTPYDVN